MNNSKDLDYTVPSLKRSKLNIEADHIDKCSTNCYKKFPKNRNLRNDCLSDCKSLKMGFNYPVFYSSNIPMGGSWVTENGKVKIKKGSELENQINALDKNIIKTLITGEGQVLGKNYIYPMDKELKIPFTDKYLNANCVDPKTGLKKRRNMYIRGIPEGDVTRYAGLDLNLPEEPVDWTSKWTLLFTKIDKDPKKGKKRLENILKELKKKCFTFLYDVKVDSNGEWNPYDQLKIPPNCEQTLKTIDSNVYQKIIDFDKTQKTIFAGSLKGLIPSIVEDVLDVNPISLIHKSGLITDSEEEEKCLTITQGLGEARYSNPTLKPYKFEVFTNYSDKVSFKNICIIIVVVLFFLILFII